MIHARIPEDFEVIGAAIFLKVEINRGLYTIVHWLRKHEKRDRNAVQANFLTFSSELTSTQ